MRKAAEICLFLFPMPNRQPLVPKIPASPAPANQLTAAPNLTLTLALAGSQALHVHLSEPADRLTIENLAKHQALLEFEKYKYQQYLVFEAGELSKTYHLGSKPTRNRGYDDRITVRLGLSRTTIFKLLIIWQEHAGRRGGLRHKCAGKKYIITESACREWLGDVKAPGR